MSIVRKGEIRALVDPKAVGKELTSLDATLVKLSDGDDFYFDNDLFESGRHFRVRAQRIERPERAAKDFIHLKVHEPDYRKMNVYTTYAVPVPDHRVAIETMKHLGHKRTFVEKWRDCAEYELRGVKLELFDLLGWGWLLEVESPIKGSVPATYKKLVSVAEELGVAEKGLTNVEPAVHLYRRYRGG